MRVLVVTGGYLPGYKHGGPIRTISAIVNQLGDDIEFYIVTSGLDLGETEPYEDVDLDTWNRVGKAKVWYTMNQRRSLRLWRTILAESRPDVVYLNSFFSVETRYFLLWRRLGLIPAIPALLAPRGEFSIGALKQEPWKKQIYLTIVKRLGLYDGLAWHASAVQEKLDIRRALTKTVSQIYTAPDLIDLASQVDTGLIKSSDAARFIFVSRIVPKKNLMGAISAIGRVSEGATLSIFGPLEDQNYWDICREEIDRTGLGKTATYQGELSHSGVQEVLPRHHFFLFPTLGENFGHVIAEALNQGLPVLISDQTPWRNLEIAGVGWDIPLGDTGRWNEVIDYCISMDDREYQEMSARCREYVDIWMQEQGGRRANLEMFQLSGPSSG